MHFIQNATQGEKLYYKKVFKKKITTISEDEITFWLKMIEKKGALDLSFNHLKQVSERAIEISDKTDKKLFRIVSFVISSIITKITKSAKKILMNKTAIVVGSGFGGISAALRLKSLGYEVSIYEKLDQLGGRARVFKKSGFTFDAGPTVITAPFLFNELFELFKKIEKNMLSLSS